MNKIPIIPSVEGWKDILIKENNEILLSLKSINHNRIIVSPQYYSQQIKNSINDCYVRESVYDKLIIALKALPNNYKFIIWDAWRPLSVQQSLFNHYYKLFEIENSNLNEHELLLFTQQYVSLPSDNPYQPSPHFTGGSIDLSIIDNYGDILDMGTKFDEFESIASTRYYEEKLEKNIILTSSEFRILENRRLLFYIMINAGFTNLNSEWWHYDYGNSFWAKIKNKTAIYSIPIVNFK